MNGLGGLVRVSFAWPAVQAAPSGSERTAIAARFFDDARKELTFSRVYSPRDGRCLSRFDVLQRGIRP